MSSVGTDYGELRASWNLSPEDEAAIEREKERILAFSRKRLRRRIARGEIVPNAEGLRILGEAADFEPIAQS